MSPEEVRRERSASEFARRVKSASRNCARYATGRVAAALHRVAGDGGPGTFAILAYHGCTPHVAGVTRPSLNVRPERLRAQLTGLKRLGYTARPLSWAIRARQRGEPIPPKTVVITFDDGFASVYRWAWPMLCDLAMPAALFLNTAYLDSPDPFPFDDWGMRNRERLPAEAYRPLTTGQCAEMLTGGLVELGAHTHAHVDFRGRPGELRRDLSICLAELARRFGLAHVPFAFPFGKWDDQLLEAARQSGVTCALTSDGRTIRPGEDPIGWPRFNVYDFDTPGMLAAKCEGWCDGASRVRSLVSLDW